MKILSLLVGAALLSCFSSQAADAQKPLYSKEMICRAAIAHSFGHSPKIVSITKVKDGIYYTRYSRPSDGRVYEFRCKFRLNRVVYATLSGRWRMHPEYDSLLAYSFRKKRLHFDEHFPDGGKLERSYDLSDF